MKNLFKKFESLNGASFIGINNYLAKTSGELANHRVNVGISVENAKKTDLMRLKACTIDDLQMISKASNIDISICEVALAEMVTSAEKNLAKEIENRSAQSQAQTNAYIPLTKNGSVKFHIESMAVHVFGMAIDKTILVKGEYKVVKSRDKTIAKNAIKKHLDLRADKFRTYILTNADAVKIKGDTIEI